jgi:hypothetical protein
MNTAYEDEVLDELDNFEIGAYQGGLSQEDQLRLIELAREILRTLSPDRSTTLRN